MKASDGPRDASGVQADARDAPALRPRLDIGGQAGERDAAERRALRPVLAAATTSAEPPVSARC